MSCSLHIICVNYKNNQQTESFIKNLLTLKNIELCKIWLVNNSAAGANDSSFNQLLAIAPHNLRVINAPENLGYFGAARAAYQEISKTKFEWVIITNTDMHIDDLELFSKLRSYECVSNAVVIAPSIISSLTGYESNPLMRYRPSKLRMHFYKWMFALRIFSQGYHLLALLKSKIKLAMQGNVSQPKQQAVWSEIYAPHGAVIFFHRSYFENGGSFEHKPFLYCEEFSVAERVRRMQKKIILEPLFQLFHEERGSTGLFYSAEVLNYKKEANKYIADTYFK